MFSVSNPLFLPPNRKIDRKGGLRAPSSVHRLPPTVHRPRRSIVDLPGASFSVNILPPAEGLCAFDPRCSFQRAEIIDYRTDPFYGLEPPFRLQNRENGPQINANRRKWLLTVPGNRPPPSADRPPVPPPHRSLARRFVFCHNFCRQPKNYAFRTRHGRLKEHFYS